MHRIAGFFYVLRFYYIRKSTPAPDGGASTETTDIPLVVFDKPDSDISDIPLVVFDKPNSDESMLPQAGNVDSVSSSPKPASSSSSGTPKPHKYWHMDCRSRVKSMMTTLKRKSYIVYFCKKEKMGEIKILKKIPV